MNLLDQLPYCNTLSFLLWDVYRRHADFIFESTYQVNFERHEGSNTLLIKCGELTRNSEHQLKVEWDYDEDIPLLTLSISDTVTDDSIEISQSSADKIEWLFIDKHPHLIGSNNKAAIEKAFEYMYFALRYSQSYARVLLTPTLRWNA